MAVINSGVFRHLKLHGIEAGFGGGGFGREGFDQGPDFGGLDPGSAAAGAGGQGLGGAGIGLESDSGGARPGETFALPESQVRQDLGAFAEFSEARDTFTEKLGAFLGFGAEATPSVKRGAELADPSAFSAGVKTGLGFETAAALSSLGGLPTSVAVGIVDRIASVAASPAFAAGRASINNPLSKVAPVAGTAAGVAAQSIGLARAVELGLSVAGVASQVPPSLRAESGQQSTQQQILDSDSGADTARNVAQTQPRQPSLGARIEATTTQDFERQRRTLATREQLGRGALTVRRA